MCTNPAIAILIIYKKQNQDFYACQHVFRLVMFQKVTSGDNVIAENRCGDFLCTPQHRVYPHLTVSICVRDVMPYPCLSVCV